MKSIARNLILGISLFSLLGCSTSSNFYMGAASDRTDTSISNKYIKFKGDDVFKIKVEGSAVKVAIETKKGMIDVEISNKIEKSYVGHIDNNMEFTVNVTPGEYTISLCGHDHSGSYKFDWSK